MRGMDCRLSFEAKRDLLAGLLRGSGFEPVPAAGTYFQLVDYGALSQESDMEFRRPADSRGENSHDPAVAVLCESAAA